MYNFQYDFIICGAGAAGLSLAYRICMEPELQKFRFLLLERDIKDSNDRTWCFWEKSDDLFQDAVFHEWKELYFFSHLHEKKLDLDGYTYKMIRSKEFYKMCMDKIQSSANFDFIHTDINSWIEDENQVIVKTANGEFHAKQMLHSILPADLKDYQSDLHLLQHFKGWFIKSPNTSFDPNKAHFMDFRADQKHGTTFVYFLPLSKDTALVEYTLFSSKILEKAEYEEGIKTYIDEVLNLKDYEIIEEENGIIPMSDYPYPNATKRIIPMGTAGGWTKASTGFTFKFTQKHTASLVKSLKATGSFQTSFLNMPKRFPIYDKVMLRVLAEGSITGEEIFETIFDRCKAEKVLKFLDNDSSFLEEVGIMKTMPTLTFSIAMMKNIFS